MLKVEFGYEDVTCLSCGDKEHGTAKVAFNREKNSENIITFHLCRQCLNKLAREFHKFS